MIVLTAIAIFITGVVLYLLITHLNDRFGLKRYRYDFLEPYKMFGCGLIIDITLFFGSKWYESSLVTGGDILNGLVLMAIGVIIILSMIYYNIKRTNFIIGLLGSVIQVPIAMLFGVLFVVAAIALAATVKPVYDLSR